MWNEIAIRHQRKALAHSGLDLKNHVENCVFLIFYKFRSLQVFGTFSWIADPILDMITIFLVLLFYNFNNMAVFHTSHSHFF